jgi:hypothetical protein
VASLAGSPATCRDDGIGAAGELIAAALNRGRRADAFCATRLDGDWGRAIGTLPSGLAAADHRASAYRDALIDRAAYHRDVFQARAGSILDPGRCDVSAGLGSMALLRTSVTIATSAAVSFFLTLPMRQFA